MKELSWEDLNVRTTGWKDREGRLRVFVSIKGCAFVNHTFWIDGWTPDKPETRASVLLMINRELDRKIKSLLPYLLV